MPCGGSCCAAVRRGRRGGSGTRCSTRSRPRSSAPTGRSRRRFWDGDPAALGTLHECLDILTRLLAPLIPFVTEEVWGALFTTTGGQDSVHLAAFPTADPSLIDPALTDQVALVRRLVEL